jgi:hypothetical protein
MTYACPAWELAADNHLLKLQRLQNEVFRNTENFSGHTSVRYMHMAFKFPYIHDYATKLCRQQTEVIQNHENESIRKIEQGELRCQKEAYTWKRSSYMCDTYI